MKLKCFGIAREIISKEELQIQRSADVKTVGSLKKWIVKEFPEMKKVKGFVIAIDQEYANDKTEISENSEIAIIPPVSGG